MDVRIGVTFAQQLIKKLQNKEAVIGVIGLGYVGLPLAVEKAKAGYDVIGFDIQEKRVQLVNEGINYIGDVIDDDLQFVVTNEKLKATRDYSFIQFVDAVMICVPTPLDAHQQPDISYVRASAEQVAEYLKEGALVVLESTTYPGTTEEVIQPILERRGFVIGENVFLAYSPERIDPGNKRYNAKNTPKVVGGVTEVCTKIAATLYRSVLEGDVMEVSSPKVAEMEKILENTFRNINIALVNEMAILCNRMGIDIWEVIEAASTKPYGFMAFYPGPGLGGHCIPVDPFYLTWKAREYNYHTRLIEIAGEINNSMPEFVVERLTKILNGEKKALNGANIVILGVAYKKDIDDTRESPVLRIIQLLTEAGASWTVIDPNVTSFKMFNRTIVYTAALTEQLLKEADVVLLATDHSAFNYEWIAEHASIIFDTRNAFKHVKYFKGKYYKL